MVGNNADQHHDAPAMGRVDTMLCMSSPLMPPGVGEIAILARTKFGTNRLRCNQQGDNPTLPAAVAAGGQHREKSQAAGDQLDPLVAWYSLVAKPTPHKMLATMPRAQAAIDAEWQRLQDCDEGRGTWGDSEVRNYWVVQA